MKQLILFAIIVLGIDVMNAQISFSDDFESYEVGSYIDASSEDWKTWNSSPGSASDCQVTDENARSGTKSLKIFGSNGNSGGPMDILLPFQAVYTSGQFVYESSLYVIDGKNAHLNMQAKRIQGQQWALYINFEAGGILNISSGLNEPVFSTTYPVEEWFTFKMDIDLNNNIWKVSVNDNCVGSFSNNVASLGSMSYYAINGNTEYFLDDVAFSHEESNTTITLDASIENIVYDGGKLEGVSQTISFDLANKGVDTLTSVGIMYGINGSMNQQTIDGFKLGPGERQRYTTQEMMQLGSGRNQLSIRITEINGAAGDDNDCNNQGAVIVDALKPALYKGVIVEEGTGTWCPWCVRGTVFMDRLSHAYKGFFIPIAVHNGDPMVVTEYDTFIGNWPNFTGYPNVVIARRDANGFGVLADIEDPFLEEVQTPAPLFLSAGLEYDPVTRVMNINAYVTFLWDVEGEYHLNLVLTEDGVTGTGSGYAQANAYAGGAQGPMGGYEFLPSPVPAEQMVYDHVARAVYGLTPSASNTISGSFEQGQIVAVSFQHTLDANQNFDNMHIIPIVNKGNKFVNARTVTTQDALARGLTGIKPINQTVNVLQAFPNPVSDRSTIAFELPQSSPVDLEVVDINGRIVSKVSFEGKEGLQQYTITTGDFEDGIYIVRVRTLFGSASEKIFVSY
jgi:hypothetical protein